MDAAQKSDLPEQLMFHESPGVVLSLEEAEAEAARYAIDATPTVLVGKFKLVGSAPIDVLRTTIERATTSE